MAEYVTEGRRPAGLQPFRADRFSPWGYRALR